VEGILAALKAEDSEWANKYLEVGVALLLLHGIASCNCW